MKNMKLLYSVTIICLNAITYSSFAQNIYFVSGTPFTYQNRYIVEKPIIFSYNQKKQNLDTIQLLSERDSCTLLFLNVYEEYNTLIMYEEGIYPKDENYLTIVNLKKPREKISKRIDFGSYNSTRQANLIAHNKKDFYYYLHIGNIGYFGYDADLKQKEILPHELKNCYIKGSQGNALNRSDWLQLQKDEKYFYIDTRLYKDKVDLTFLKLPSDSLLRNWGTYRYFYTVSVNNNDVAAIIINNSIPEENKNNTIEYLMLCKQTKEWHTIKFEGGGSSLVGYGKWLAGTTVDYNHGTYYLEKGKPVNYNFKRITPGVQNRRPLYSISEQDFSYEESESFDQRNNKFGDYYPGVLFLYNVETRSYIQWDALEKEFYQGDSEILLVQDEVVYYRVNDKIYSSPIVNGKKLGKQTLLIQHDIVRDIHWAFISKK